MNKNQLEELAKEQLERLHVGISGNHQRSITTRNWCITVWTASLMLPFAREVPITSIEQVILSLLPVVLFWFLDSFQLSFSYLHQQRALELEKIIATNSWDSYDRVKFSYLAGWQGVSKKKKLGALCHCLLFQETTVVFYILLIVGTALFAIIFR